MKGNAGTTKVHLKGKNDDFVVMVDSKEAVQQWKKDKTVPLAQVVSGWKIFVTHGQGNQGILDTASKAMLDDEFGTHRDEDVVQQILERGSVVESDAKGRDGGRNDTQGDFVAH